MNPLTQDFDLAIFWRGEDVAVPERLVCSLRLSFGEELEIHQLTDNTTPQIPMVTHCHRGDLNPNIMVARIEACARLKLNRPTLFLDADMLVLERFELPAFGPGDVLVTSRQQDFYINANFPEHYPEFVGKTFGQMMPFVFSFVATGNSEFFPALLSNIRSMPERFHRWYGDQMSLKQEYDREKFRFRNMPEEKFNFAIRRGLRPAELAELTEKFGVKILHFKGRNSKKGQAETLAALPEFRGKRN